MLTVRQFLRNNATSIITLSLIIFLTLVFFASINDTFKDVAPYDSPPEKSQKYKVVTVEAYENTVAGSLPNTAPHQAFCQQYQSRPHELEARCKLLSPKACHIPSCCVLRNGKDCVAGNQHGPTFLGGTTHFSHKGTCRGDACPNE